MKPKRNPIHRPLFQSDVLLHYRKISVGEDASVRQSELNALILCINSNNMPQINSISQLDLKGTYTYADYLTWKFEQALELIKGKILPMPAPSRAHQKLSWRLTIVFDNFFKNHRCEAYAAPFDVRLYDRKKSQKSDKDIYTVVQPDLCVVCDLAKLDDKGCLGAPDLIVEILSPGNSKREMKTKKDLYAESGVLEYWILDYTHETVTLFNLEGESTYGRPLIFVSDDPMTSVILSVFKKVWHTLTTTLMINIRI